MIISLLTIKRRLSEKLRVHIRHSYYYRKFSFIRDSVSIKKQLRKNLSVPDSLIETKEYIGKKVLVPLIETTHYQNYQALLVAKALQLRGAEVSVLLCDAILPGCGVKSLKNTQKDPCLGCKMNSRHLVPEFNLSTIQLSNVVPEKKIEHLQNIAKTIVADYPEYYEYAGINIITTVNDSVTRYFYGGVPTCPSVELDEVRLRYVTSILIGFEAAESIEKSWEPDIIFGIMNVYTDWAPYHQYFESKGKQVNTISISAFNYKAVLLNSNHLYISNQRYLDWMDINASKPLTSDQESELQCFIDNRFKGNSDVFKAFGYFDNDSEIIKFDKSKRNIFLFSNIFWDVGMSECGGLYPDVITWVLSSIELLRNYPNCHLYIKPHPAENFDVVSVKGVVDFISERFPKLPSNITIIFPQMKILTYDLFPHIDVGVVSNGTLGLEMLLSDIPVISCGKTPYGGINLVSEPDTEESYLNLLLGEEVNVSPSKSQVRQFAYFYFVKTLIPWSFTETAYSDVFSGFNMQDITGIMPNSNYYLDHICKAILEREKTAIDNW